jgi:hypothetical protein
MLFLLDTVKATTTVPNVSVKILRSGVIVYSIVVYGANLTYQVSAT